MQFNSIIIHSLQTAPSTVFPTFAVSLHILEFELKADRFQIVLSIPIMMLWNVRIPLKKKLILFSLFSAIIVVVVVSIIRVAVVSSKNRHVDISWLYLWSNVEMSTCKFPCVTLKVHCAN